MKIFLYFRICQLKITVIQNIKPNKQALGTARFNLQSKYQRRGSQTLTCDPELPRAGNKTLT